jgi:hypothetical protein
MAVHFLTASPTQSQALLAAFDKAIANAGAKGSITTWEKTPHGYTHKSTEWGKKAYFQPAPLADRLTMNILRPPTLSVDSLVYSYYHGHLIRTFIEHFPDGFTVAAATPKAASGDKLS